MRFRDVTFALPMSTATLADLKHTPLYPVHKALGARLVDFGGWEMPVEYSGIREEHRAVRERAGLFDVSHMGEFEVEGREALPLLQRLTCNDVSRLAVGRCHYTALLTDRGTFIDDLLVSRAGESRFLMVVNAGNTPKDLERAKSIASGYEAKVTDRTEGRALLALQGPQAEAVLARLTEMPLGEIPYYGFLSGIVSGAPTLVSRTGYTGEDGFEVACPREHGARLFREILDAGRP